MELAYPEALLLAPVGWILLVLLVRLGRRKERSHKRTVVSTVIRGAILLLLAAALAGPHRPFVTREDRMTVLIADGSASVSTAGAAEIEERRREIEGEGPLVVVPFGDALESDPRSAVLRAAVEDAGRTVIATDGLLSAPAAPLLSDLRGTGRAMGVLPLASESAEAAGDMLPRPEIVVRESLSEDRPTTVTVNAPGAETVTLTVDGTPVGQADVVDGVARFPDLELKAGQRFLVARASGGGRGSASSTVVPVAGPLRVLVLGGGPDHPFARALAVQGIEVETSGDAGPGVPDLDSFRVVVTLPRFRLPADGGPLTAFIRSGGGLLAATGPAPGLAQYENDPVADLLPAEAVPSPPEIAPKPPEEEPKPPEPEAPPGASPEIVEKEASKVSLVLVVDTSGSMGGPKIQLARAASYQAAMTLDERDRLGVIAFSDTWEWIHPLTDAGDRRGLRNSLMKLRAAGGTEIYPAMKGAHEGMKEETSPVRHVILFSDGQGVLTAFKRLISAMRKERITVSTIGIGQDYNLSFLGSIARWGGGRFYDASDPRDLPRVVTLDTQRVMDTVKPPEKPPEEKPPNRDVTAGSQQPATADEPEPEQPTPDEPVAITAPSPLPFLEGLSFPPVAEVEPATPRFPAQAALVTEEGSPVLTLWRYGVGRVALLGADPTAWAGWEDLPRFASQVVRQLAGGDRSDILPPPLLTVRDDRVEVLSDGPVRASASVDGRRSDLELFQSGPGRWLADLPPAPAGSLVSLSAAGEAGPAARYVFVAPGPPEARHQGIDEDSIDRLADAGGLPPGEMPPPPEENERPGREPAELPLLLAALFLVPLDVAVRRVRR